MMKHCAKTMTFYVYVASFIARTVAIDVVGIVGGPRERPVDARTTKKERHDVGGREIRTLRVGVRER